MLLVTTAIEPSASPLASMKMNAPSPPDPVLGPVLLVGVPALSLLRVQVFENVVRVLIPNAAESCVKCAC